MPKFLITTATGRQGTSTVRLLLAKGAEVNALVRDPSSAASLALQSMGATLFKGGFDDAETILAAARAAGTVASVVVSTASYTELHEDWSVVKADLPFLSQFFISKSGAERAYFPEYMSSRVLTVSFTRDFRLDQIDAADVGQVAAAALLDPARFSGAEFTLGHEGLTLDEIAAHLSRTIGKEVTAKYRTAEETAEARKTTPMVEMQLWAPTLPRVEDAKLAEYGFRWTTFEEFLEREKSAIRKTVGIDIEA
ncbi:NAD dependent epimerase/dehydratase [Mycena maculata]|uniref:NAD dependent epimerase/dehydratase n=1 Tax=Mycena maculata TaxID=230809 RepID=A0AAD7IGZ1_9AGAR|nr:NAD dependent epimerase/dehydratase [Mycena maculata]